jgi:hypothetical protein
MTNGIDRDALTREIASILDYPSIYMGAPSNRSLRYAEKIVGLLDEHIADARAEADRLFKLICEERNATQSLIAAARTEALEEAALMTEARAVFYTTVGAIACRQAAQAIRALAKSAAQGDKT